MDKRKCLYYGLVKANRGYLEIGAEANSYLLISPFDFRIDDTSESAYDRAYYTGNLFFPMIFADLGECLSSSIILYPDLNLYHEYITSPCKKDPRLEMITIFLVLKAGLHANVLIVDHLNKTVEHYEPNGDIGSMKEEEKYLDREPEIYNPEQLYAILDQYIENKYQGYLLLPSTVTCKYTFGVQAKSGQGWCALFTLFYLYLRALHPNISPEEIHEFIDKIPREDYQKILEAMINFGINYAIDAKWLPYNVIATIVNEKKELMNNYYSNFYLMSMGIEGSFDKISDFYLSPDLDLASLHKLYTRLIQTKSLGTKSLMIQNMVKTISMSPSDAKRFLYNKISYPHGLSLDQQINQMNLLLEEYLSTPRSSIEYQTISSFNGEYFPEFTSGMDVLPDKRVRVGALKKSPNQPNVFRERIEESADVVLTGLKKGTIGKLNEKFENKELIGVFFFFRNSELSDTYLTIVNPLLYV